jgi:hypothetical protein
MKKQFLLFLVGLLTTLFSAKAQNTIIPIKNPSFEPEDYAPFLIKLPGVGWIVAFL